MQTSLAEWINTGATCVLAAGGVGAFVYAARTYGAQSRQLAIAKKDSARLRTPILRGELRLVGGQAGDRKYRLDVWLLTPEPLADLRVQIEEARGHDSVLGFTPGQNGVEQHPDRDSLPTGWRDDVLRHEARWPALLPAAAATWQMAERADAPKHRPSMSGVDDGPQIRLSAECTPAGGGDSWRVEVPVSHGRDVSQALGTHPATEWFEELRNDPSQD